MVYKMLPFVLLPVHWIHWKWKGKLCKLHCGI